MKINFKTSPYLFKNPTKNHNNKRIRAPRKGILAARARKYRDRLWKNPWRPKRVSRKRFINA